MEERQFTGVPWKISVTVGVTVMRATDTEEQLVRRADELLYRAKEAGRNCVLAE